MTFRTPLFFVALLALALAACGSSVSGKSDSGSTEGTSEEGQAQAPGTTSDETADDTRDPSCPATLASPGIPGVELHHLTADYWLERVGAEHDLDEVLATPTDVRSLNAVNAHPALGLSPRDQTDATLLASELGVRLDYMRERLADGRYVREDGSRVDQDVLATFATPAAAPTFADEVRVALDVVPIRCGPFDGGLFATPEVNRAFDRNNCSALHPQEPVQILSTWSNGMRYVRTRYASGWITGDAPLSPPVPDDLREVFTAAPRSRVAAGPLALTADDGSATLQAPTGATLPHGPRAVAGDDTAAPPVHHFATADGFYSAEATATDKLAGRRVLTRRALLEAAFAYLDQPYGWGGEDGGLDCSRFLLDLFDEFGIELPRASGAQARAGTYSIDVAAVTSERERELLIEAAARDGIVLLQMPGHIMLYLGRDDRGEMMALHSFAEYLVPCDGTVPPTNDPSTASRQQTDTETLYTVNRVTVSDLDLGRGSSRTAFIQRLTRITVIGHAPDAALRGAAQVRRAAPVTIPEGRDCSDSQANAVFHSPYEPSSEQPLRVIVTHSADPGPAELVLVDPDGNEHRPEVRRFGGPPFSVLATVAEPAPGTWRAVYGDGERVDACLRIRVDDRPAKREPLDGSVWTARRRWTEATENLYAAWVESLFDYPIDEDKTWSNFHEVLQDREHNFFFDHYGVGETDRLDLEPDCADLPYFLRAYFAYNMGLPFGFRRCSRGKANRPPKCNEELYGNLMSPSDSDPHRAFERFMQREVRNVHSGSGRTAPGDDETDFYPVALDHASLRPGTLYADPDGHLMIVSKWLPQGTNTYGVLMSADAQPDGTVGRRRFWRGSFLFTPDTTHVGAGFKAFRPLVVDRETGQLRAMTNAELTADNDDARGFAPYSEQQYEGSRDDFYDTMAGLINPRPLDPHAMQVWLIDALGEQVARRVNSVDNALAWVAEHPEQTIEMPQGYSIFETKGPWEDYSSPARDLRLLVAMDAVTGFADRVRRQPERYGVDPSGADDAVAELLSMRDATLAERTFEYTRSDGSAWTLTLKDVVDRVERFELSYNPNDCAELRWAAAPGTDEYAPCKRHAPAAQTKRMETYRSWFTDRQRPPR